MSYSDANTASPHAPAGASVERLLVRDLARERLGRWAVLAVLCMATVRFALSGMYYPSSVAFLLASPLLWLRHRQGVIHYPNRRQLHVRRVLRTEILDTDLPITANVGGAGERRAVRLTLEQDGRMVPTALLVDRRDLDRLPSIIQLSRPDRDDEEDDD